MKRSASVSKDPFWNVNLCHLRLKIFARTLRVRRIKAGIKIEKQISALLP